jgi:hypothetical protein
LNEITVTGKRLQVDALIQATITDCGIPLEPTIDIVSIVPNPSISIMIRVNFQVTGDITGAYFEVFDAIGAKVREDIPVDVVNAELGYIEIDPANLLAGVYFVTLRRGEQKVTRKLMVVI